MSQNQDAHDAVVAALAYSAAKLQAHHAQIARCAALLDVNETWQRDNAHCNSVGNLMLHLDGNVTQWVRIGLAPLAGQTPSADARDRPAEFAARSGADAQTLARSLSTTVTEAAEIIRQLPPERCGTRVTIQAYEIEALSAVIHVVEHFAGHTGQIVHMTKVLKDVDLSLYDPQGRPLNATGSSDPPRP